MNIQEEVIRAMNWHKDMHDRTFLYVRPSAEWRRGTPKLVRYTNDYTLTATEAMSIRHMERTVTATEIGAGTPPRFPNRKS